jgi:hypothetical protein
MSTTFSSSNRRAVSCRPIGAFRHFSGSLSKHVSRRTQSHVRTYRKPGPLCHPWIEERSPCSADRYRDPGKDRSGMSRRPNRKSVRPSRSRVRTTRVSVRRQFDEAKPGPAQSPFSGQTSVIIRDLSKGLTESDHRWVCQFRSSLRSTPNCRSTTRHAWSAYPAWPKARPQRVCELEALARSQMLPQYRRIPAPQTLRVPS